MRRSGRRGRCGWGTGGTVLLNVLWYLDVNVTNSTGDPVNATNITIVNNDSVVVFSGLTDEIGLIPTRILQEYWRNATDSHYYTNYTVTVQKNGYETSSTEVNLTTNKIIYFTLTYVDPTVTLNIPINNNNSVSLTDNIKVG